MLINNYDCFTPLNFFKQVSKFASLFAVLEQRGAEFGVSSFGVSLTTLEEVMIIF